MKPEFIEVRGSWRDVLSDCRSTVGKPPLDKEPSEEFKRAILMAEHSPIRNIVIRWKWHNMPSWEATHWSRHKFECYITTQRSDRTSIPRDKLPQDAPVDFVGVANAQHLIDTWRKRLCRQCAPETRKTAEDFKAALHEIEPELADVLTPNCVYRGECCEMNPCGYFDYLLDCGMDIFSLLRDRYETYNDVFWQDWGKRNGSE